jgi:hypothetical protein
MTTAEPGQPRDDERDEKLAEWLRQLDEPPVATCEGYGSPPEEAPKEE